MPKSTESRTVLLLIETLNRGGIENVLLRLIPAMRNEGWRSVVVTIRDGGEMLDEYRRAGIEVVTLNQSGFLTWRMVQAIRESIERIGPDVVMTNLFKADLVGRLFLGFMTPVPVVPYLVTTYNHPRYWIARVFEWLSKPLASSYIANSQAVQMFYEKRLGVAPGKIVVAPNGVDTDEFESAKADTIVKEFALPRNVFLVTCVANLASNKGQRDLLVAFDEVFSSIPNAYLLLVGDGEQREALLVQRATLRSKDRILFAGRRTDVPAILKATTVFALATHFEGMSTALLEAMAARKAIVTTNIPENKVLLSDETSALLVPPKDQTALAMALRRMYDSTALRNKLGATAFLEVSRKYSVHNVAQTFGSVFTSLCPPRSHTRKPIIHLIGSLESGGAENLLLRTLPLLNEDDAFDHQVITLTRPGELTPEFQKQNIHTSHVGVSSVMDVRGMRDLVRVIQARNPALVITYLFHASLISRLVLRRQVKSLIIPFLRSTYNFPRYLPARIFEILTKPLVGHYFANSEAVRDYYVSNIGVPAHKITVIHNGIDVSVYDRADGASVRATLGLPESSSVITCVANLASNKGHRYLLESFEKLAPKYPAAYLLIVGEGAERAALERQVLAYRSKDRILFLGRRSDIPNILAATDVFVLPTLFEGLSNAVLEAMAARCAIVTTDIPESRVVIRHDDTGLLVPIENSVALAEAIDRLMGDTALRKRIGDRARDMVVKHFDLHVIAHEWNDQIRRFTKLA